MLCPSCHTQNRDNAKFCKGCGQPLAVEVVATDQPVPGEQQTEAGQAPVQEVPPSAAKEKEVTTAEHEKVSPTSPYTHPAGDAQSTSSVEAPADAGTHGADVHATTVPASNESVPGAEDLETAPTQILTPEQMLEYRARRGHQDAEREQREQQEQPYDIADAPTILMSPFPTQQEDRLANDSAANTNHQHGQEQAIPEQAELEQYGTPSPREQQEQPVEPEDVAQEQEPVETAEEHKTTDAATTPETHPEAASGQNEEEKHVERSSQQETENTEQTEQGTKEFPVLAVGTVVGGRYEVTQVLGEDEHEHVYETMDHQGYQHCWNCGSEQNSEGDEFCIDCGAELSNASYTMREYPQSSTQNDEAQVLHGAIVNTFVDHDYTYVIEQPQSLQSAFPNGVRLVAAADSDAGMVRRADVNEDSTLAVMLERVHESIATPVGLFVVADGMGGHANGQGASRLAIGMMTERVVRDLVLPPLQAEKEGEGFKALDEDGVTSLLQSAIEDANTAICQVNQRDKSDMGCTLTGFMIVGDHAYIFNVGDSRTYMLRDEKLYQLTNDHSLVGQLVAGGLITPEDVYTHPQRNQIFRSIGDKANVQIDLFKQQIHPGDVLLSCSDGLWEMVRDPQITELLNQAADPQTACSRLIETANANGGEDNVSAVVVFVR